jgi:hypothetical protein
MHWLKILNSKNNDDQSYGIQVLAINMHILWYLYAIFIDYAMYILINIMSANVNSELSITTIIVCANKSNAYLDNISSYH